MLNTDGPLALSVKGFSDGVSALAEPQPQWLSGVCRWTDPLYLRLRDALRGQTSGQGRRVPDSRPPCRTDILTHVIDVDMTVAEWCPGGDGAIDRLRRLRDRT